MWIRSKLLVLSLLLMILPTVCAFNAAAAPIPFQITVNLLDVHHVAVRFTMPAGHYLYRDKLVVTYKQQPLSLHYPRAEKIDSAWVYTQPITLLVHSRDGFAELNAITVYWQGCHAQGLCYTPQKTQLILKPGQWRENTLTNQIKKSFYADIKQLLFFYLAGLSLAFTACMYPLLPIISSLVIGTVDTRYRKLALPIIYTQSMALIYVVFGLLTAHFGALFISYLSPYWLAISMAVFFVLMAFAMFDFFHFQMPHQIQTKLVNITQHLPQGRFLSAMLLGFASAFIISPCVAPPLAAALAYIGVHGQYLFAGLALYCLALGIGTPLLMVALLGQRILPRVPVFIMHMLKMIWGFILLLMAWWFIQPFLPILLATALCMAILTGISYFIGKWIVAAKPDYGYVFIMTVFCGFSGFISVQANRLTTPSVNTTHKKEIATLTELQTQLHQAQGKTVMVYFHADWCAACQKMTAKLQDKAVQIHTKEWVIFTVDLTQSNQAKQALLKQFGIYGPPALLFFNRQGGLINSPVIGYRDPESLLKIMRANKMDVLK